ncbi:Transcription factor atf21 [Fusarium albosuccineum]|uniref:Transcription factor atf21 n=1 Tax=Fusarium albosuccineum TaxID=1237068 RepID=A0A8H4L247_9HYPO|nr:Transcription factor atf21 [Fusarium albosuccineum]
MDFINNEALCSFPWEQWYAIGESDFPDPSDSAAPDASLYTQDNPQQQVDLTPHHKAHRQNEASVTVLPQDYTVFLPDFESTSPQSYLCKSEAQSAWSSGQRGQRKRTRTPDQRRLEKPSKHGARKNHSEAAAGDAQQDFNTKGAQDIAAVSSLSANQDSDRYQRKVQERNRVASSKFRTKKKEDARKLKSDEQGMEEINHRLSSCAADLTLEVYRLKMKLLQHTDCSCSLIQTYIANEAQRYIRDLDEEHHEVHCRS